MGQGDRDRCRRQHLPDEHRPASLERRLPAQPDVGGAVAGQRAAAAMATYAIIGPGGGVDVLRAVANGSPNVTGIEINPIIANDIMRDRFADYTYHLYEIPEVHMHVSDGRSFVRNSRDQYDVVQMTLVDTWASTAAGAFALSENNLYTVEAFREYFEHLKPDGHDRHHALGICPAARGAARGLAGHGGAAPAGRAGQLAEFHRGQRWPAGCGRPCRCWCWRRSRRSRWKSSERCSTTFRERRRRTPISTCMCCICRRRRTGRAWRIQRSQN